MFNKLAENIINEAKATVCCLGFLFVSLITFGQGVDTTKTVRIIGPRDTDNDIAQKIDSTQKQFLLSQDAATLLELNSNTYIRNYGISNLSTLSIRGSSAAQTNVLWSGIPIQNNMLGLTDLSTLPSFFFDDITVQPSAFNHQGRLQSMGGCLVLDNDIKFATKNEFASSLIGGFESLENTVLGAKASLNTRNYKLGIKFLQRRGANRYVFENPYSNQLDTITNSNVNQRQVLMNIAWRLRRKNRFSIQYWHIDNERQIPALAFELNDERIENNKVNRLAIEHAYNDSAYTISTSVGLTIDSFRYADGRSNLFTQAQVINLPINSTLKYYLSNNSQIGFALNSQFSWYKKQDRAEQLSQNAVQLFYRSDNVWQKIQFDAFIQQQFTSINNQPFTYGARLSRSLGKYLFTYGSFNTNFRIPTLNELYYFPGGNVDLKPERSKNLECGLNGVVSKGALSLSNDFSIYSRWVEDWILWSGAAIFFPDNIAAVWSRGIENKLSVKVQDELWTIRNDFFLGLNRATSERAHFVNDQSVGKQIPYVPRTVWRNNLYANYWRLTAQLSYNYTGYRFITRDETEFVDPFHVLNIFFGYKQPIKKLQYELQFKINNVSNQFYESVRGRVMPGRNYGLVLLVNLKM